MKIYANNSVTTNITPTPGGGQSDAAQLNPGYNAINDAASSYDSVQLPAAKAGSIVIGFVTGIQTKVLGVYAKFGTSDVINSEIYESSNSNVFFWPSAFVVGDNQIFIAQCIEDGIWRSNVTAN